MLKNDTKPLSKKQCLKKVSILFKHLMASEKVSVKDMAKTVKISQQEMQNIVDGKQLPDIYTYILLQRHYKVYNNDIFELKSFDIKLPFSRLYLEQDLISAIKYLPDYVLKQFLRHAFKYYAGLQDIFYKDETLY